MHKYIICPKIQLYLTAFFNIRIVETQNITSLQVWMRNGLLHITGLTTGETLSVYTATGALVYHSIANSNEMDITLRRQGVYIIRNGKNVVKVVVSD